MSKPNLAMLAGLVATLWNAAAMPQTAAELDTDILIRNVSVWDGNSDNADPGQNVLIHDNLIKSIGPRVAPGPGTFVIDGGGRVLIPGIIEAHTHISSPISEAGMRSADPTYIAARSMEIARGILMRGWTTIRDIGGPSQGLAKAIDEGHAIGPRIYSSAMVISQTSGHGDGRDLNDLHPNMGGARNGLSDRYALLADGPAEVTRAVRESLRHGATAIKVMAGGGISSDYDPLDTVQYSVEEMRAAVLAAEQWNTYVAVHAYTDAAVRNALEAGVKVIEHGHLLSEETLKLLKARGAYLSSQSFGFVRTIVRSPNSKRGAKALMVMDGVDNMMTTAKRLGIPVAFGTDSFGSVQVFEGAPREFGYRLRWFDSLEILKQATSINARLLELTGPRNPYQAGPLGVIKPGAYADLLIVDGNPLTDVRILEDYASNIRLIMKDGVVYKNTLVAQHD
jgi:imidazolonepropionase-like amidohydrolase